ncbi:MAG: response regulator transcription factor, partial [Anaerolineales bacterium]|nr:response regulator transcription factor [Anaerolineales bacterium]
MPPEENIQVLVVDDHLIVREGLRLILETAEGIDLVGEAEDGEEALALVESLDPDVVLMDLRMPGMGGIAAIEALAERDDRAAVIILTTYDEDEMMVRGLRAGARGYLLKDTDRTTLLDCIRAAARGEALLTPEVMSRLLAQTHAPQAERANQRPTDLTERELEVLEGVAQGERNKEIAARLGITERTVKAHMTSIFNKFGVDSRAAAIAVAAQRG